MSRFITRLLSDSSGQPNSKIFSSLVALFSIIGYGVVNATLGVELQDEIIDALQLIALAGFGGGLIDNYVVRREERKKHEGSNRKDEVRP